MITPWYQEDWDSKKIKAAKSWDLRLVRSMDRRIAVVGFEYGYLVFSLIWGSLLLRICCRLNSLRDRGNCFGQVSVFATKVMVGPMNGYSRHSSNRSEGTLRPATCELPLQTLLRDVRMAEFGAALRHAGLSTCRNFRAASACSKK
jgi:hypothetical protein